MLLTAINNVGSTTLFNPVELQAHDFLPCSENQALIKIPILIGLVHAMEWGGGGGAYLANSVVGGKKTPPPYVP